MVKIDKLAEWVNNFTEDNRYNGFDLWQDGTGVIYIAGDSIKLHELNDLDNSFLGLSVIDVVHGANGLELHLESVFGWEE